MEIGAIPGVTEAKNEQLKVARRRILEFEMENQVLRRATAYLTQADL